METVCLMLLMIKTMVFRVRIPRLLVARKLRQNQVRKIMESVNNKEAVASGTDEKNRSI